MCGCRCAAPMAAGIWLALMAGCSGSRETPTRTIEPLGVEAAVKRVASTRIFFAHQSVGENILDGIRSLEREDGRSDLNIVDGRAVPSTTGAFFAHARLGTNGDPASKTDAFVKVLEEGLGNQVDMAFQKYCFADITESTDVRQVFEYYRRALAGLHERFPRVLFVHVTVPLVAVQAGPRAAIKKLLDRMPDHYAADIQREQFNALLRREYEGREPVFDLAAIESTRPDGSREQFHFGNVSSYAMVPSYTTDGGHLTGPAARMVGARLLSFLSTVLDRRGASQGRR